MKKVLSAFFIFFIILPFVTIAGNGVNDSALRGKVNQWMNSTGIRFLENKGQMFDQQRKPIPNVLYEANGGGMDVYVTTSGLSYVCVKYNKYKKKTTSSVQLNFKQHNDSITETWCRADMQLVGVSIKKENIIQEGESTDRTDYYYGGICPNGILGVHSYSKITIKNIYPGIDWVLHSGKKGLKYDFIVHPGANPSLIKLKYKWTDKPQLQEDGSVKISTPMGSITEGRPVSYVDTERSRSMGISTSLNARKQVQTSYLVKDSEISFNLGNYNSTQTLTIDPQLVWATYYGIGYRADEVSSMQEDGKHVWITGYTFSSTLPTHNPGGGAYFQDTTAAPFGTNIYILEFNTAGVLQWCTYYGGAAMDEGSSIYSDSTNIWVTGYTSSINFPTYNPGNGAYYQGTLVGGQDVFILQFTTAGVRKWATYYGGGSDEGNSIQSDGKNVWVAGGTKSAAFPTLNPGGGAYYQATIGGKSNAFILQFDTGKILKWATYYGGTPAPNFALEQGNSIYSDGHSVWVTGYESSTNFPTYNPGNGAYFQGAPGGLTNSYILQFNMAGVRKWATYYGGNDTLGIGDWGMSIYSDRNNVWITGLCASTNFPTYNPGGGAYFQATLASKTNSNVYILKFDTTGVRKWATCYGGAGRNNVEGELGYSIQSDGKNVWVGGATLSANFPTLISPCGYNDDTLGNVINFGDQDAFILQFDTAGVRKWATFYGADEEDDGSYVWSDGYNVFIACDAEADGEYPIVNPGGGAYIDSVLQAMGETIVVGKFVEGGILSVGPGAIICRGDSTRLSASGAVSYSWKPATGLSDTNTPNPYAKPEYTTTYTVTGIDTGICGGTHKDSVTVRVDTIHPFISKDTTICSGSSITLNAGTGTIYNWSTGATTSSTSIMNDTATKTYTVSIQNGACIRDTDVTVKVLALSKPVISGTAIKCLYAIDTLTVSSSVNPTTYKWGNGSTSTFIITGKIVSDTTVYVTAYNSLGCPVTDSIDVMVKLPPSVDINPPTIACSGTETHLKAVAGGTGPFTYLWSPGGKTTDTITVNPDTLTYYSVLVSNGCDTLKTTWVKPDNPRLEACCDNIIFAGDDTTLIAQSPTAKTFKWEPSVICIDPRCDSVQVSPTVTTTYTVISTDSAGCQVERIITIEVEIPCADFTVPNVFTPGYAGILGLNNVFYIKTPLLGAWDITIYDRWGKEMFHSTNPAQYWGGNTENGSKAPDGVYYYIIHATCQNNTFKKDGFVQVIR